MAKRNLADAPEGGTTYERANSNYEGGEVRPLPPLDEDTTARLRRLRLAGEEPMARVYVVGEDGLTETRESL